MPHDLALRLRVGGTRDAPVIRREWWRGPADEGPVAPELLSASPAEAVRPPPVPSDWIEYARVNEQVLQSVFRSETGPDTDHATRDALERYGRWLLHAVLIGRSHELASELEALLDVPGSEGLPPERRLLVEVSGDSPKDEPLAAVIRELSFELAYHERRHGFLLEPPQHVLVARVARIDAFGGARRYLRPAAYVGVACPEDAPLPSFEYYDIFRRVQERGGSLPLTIQMRFSGRPPARGSRVFKLVILVCHGDYDSGEPVLVWVQGETRTECQRREVPLERLRAFLAACQAEVVVLVACQERRVLAQGDRVFAHPEIGETLLESSEDGGLQAVISFRARLPLDSAGCFLESLSSSLVRTEQRPFRLLSAVREALDSMPTRGRGFDTSRLDFALPTVRVRQEIRIDPPRPFEFLSLSGLRVEFRRDLLLEQARALEKSGEITRDDLDAYVERHAWLTNKGSDYSVSDGHTRRYARIARYPLTCGQVAACLGRPVEPEVEDLPATALAWSEIEATLAALRNQLRGEGTIPEDDEVALPLPAEWLLACYGFVESRGRPRDLFPWGPLWSTRPASVAPSSTEPERRRVYESWTPDPEIAPFAMLGSCRELTTIPRGKGRHLWTLGGDSPLGCMALGSRSLALPDDESRLPGDVAIRPVVFRPGAG